MHGIRQAASTAVVAAGVVVAFALPASATDASRAPGAGTAPPAAVEVAAPPAGDAPAVVLSQYCTYSPDSWGRADFRPACDVHDQCYSPTSTTSRLACDQQLRADLRLACADAYRGATLTTCRGVAATYYRAVRWWGGSRYLGGGDPA